MTGLVGSSIRRIAGVFGVLAAVALIAVPVALANNDTINAQATVQFSGVVDSPPSCTRRHVGDDRLGRRHHDSPATITGSAAAIRRQRHAHLRHAAEGTYTGTITFTGGNCGSMRRHPDNFTANVAAPPPQFTRVPGGRRRTPAASS